MMESVTSKWDHIYSQTDHPQYPAVPVLTENVCLIPESGRALDLACGLGSNAIFLAKQGMAIEAWDASCIAIEKLQAQVDTQALEINPQVRAVDKHSFIESSFDVIVVSRFLDRSLSEGIISALKPGGLLFYQTYTREKAFRKGPENTDYLLNVNELLQLFLPLRVVFYRENGCLGNIAAGLRNEAQYIGQKPR